MTTGSGSTCDIHVQFRAPTFQASEDIESIAGEDSQEKDQSSSTYKASRVKRRPTSLRLSNELNPQERPLTPSIYHGSYGKARKDPRSSVRASFETRTGFGSAAASPRASASHLQLQHLLRAVDVELDTYGLLELRDGFFDASFYRPLKQDTRNEDARKSLPPSFRSHHPLSLRHFVPQQWREFLGFLESLRKYSSGLKLFKTFLGFFVAYVLCLVPASRNWLGRYNYIMVISAIVNHSGRSVGSQVDGVFMTTLGTVAGLGWGSLALYASTSTGPARAGYGGVLATFLILFTTAIAWLRCLFMRFFQAVLCAGIAICYTCLANTSEAVSWRKLFDYGIPWVLGQALCLVVSVCIFTDTGSRSLALAFHDSLSLIERGLDLPRQEDKLLRRDLAWTFVKLSTAVRDFTIELTVSRYCPADVRSVRNLIQGVIRGVLSIKPDTVLFEPGIEKVMNSDTNVGSSLQDGDAKATNTDDNAVALGIVSGALAGPTRDLIEAMVSCVRGSDYVLTNLGGVRKFFSSSNDEQDLTKALDRLLATASAFDVADARLVNTTKLSSGYSTHPEMVDVFLFVHPVRQVADEVRVLTERVLKIQRKNRKWAVNFPSYPFVKSLNRTNAQVRHDRGGLTAGFYFRSKEQLERAMEDLHSTSYVPRARTVATDGTTDIRPQDKDQQDTKTTDLIKQHDNGSSAPYRLHLWRFLRRLQDFESRFAFKMVVTTTLISIPAWLKQSRDWWNIYESWWAVVTIWVMMNPRVGGTFQDLWVRSFYAALGALWAGLGYAAGNGSPYVLAVFAVLYMIPMLHRFTQSSHPRSGIIGCLSFTVISLGAYNNHAEPAIIQYAWTRGLAFLVGVIAALVVNWILWPFIARHELRKSLSTMMLHSSILYRGVIAKYIYYDSNQAPTAADIERSEMLEGRLREGFVRIRQLLELTRHEIRLRAPFDPLPYSKLIDACERLFEHLVRVRQSSLYFQPLMQGQGEGVMAALFEVRRDAVAVILLNLYTLATALRSARPVPRYLPSAAAARQRLLDRMDLMEVERKEGREDEVEGEKESGKGKGKGRRWADVYQFAFSEALTDIVEELMKMQRWTKKIVGESGWEAIDPKKGT